MKQRRLTSYIIIVICLGLLSASALGALGGFLIWIATHNYNLSIVLGIIAFLATCFGEYKGFYKQ